MDSSMWPGEALHWRTNPNPSHTEEVHFFPITPQNAALFFIQTNKARLGLVALSLLITIMSESLQWLYSYPLKLVSVT